MDLLEGPHPLALVRWGAGDVCYFHDEAEKYERIIIVMICHTVVSGYHV